MDKKQKQAERELLEVIRLCRATRRAFGKLMVSMDPIDFEGSELKDLANGLNAVEEIEEAARRGLEKLRKPIGKP
jgi:hypothetical protein